MPSIRNASDAPRGGVTVLPAAEIDDHLNRGRNMDTRTPNEQCSFVV